MPRRTLLHESIHSPESIAEDTSHLASLTSYHRLLKGYCNSTDHQPYSPHALSGSGRLLFFLGLARNDSLSISSVPLTKE